MEFALELFTPALFTQLRPLLAEHYAELALEDCVNVPSTAPYFSLEDAGLLRVFTAREGDELVGYAFFSVAKNPQYGDALHAKQDLMFITRAARRGLEGVAFMKWCDEQLKAEGIEVIYRHLNVKQPHDAILIRMGYELRERVYTRRINPCAQV